MHTRTYFLIVAFDVTHLVATSILVHDKRSSSQLFPDFWMAIAVPLEVMVPEGKVHLRLSANRGDDPEYIVRLVGQVVTVSVETVRLVNQLADSGPAESLRIDERFQEVNGMPVHLLPVVGDPRRH